MESATRKNVAIKWFVLWGSDSREDMPSDKELAKDFEEGRITGADFFK